jgi:hypothetical protein
VRIALVLLLALVACGGKKKQKRTGDAAPVIVVPAPVYDGGAPGAATDEVEPNDSADVATPLAIGGSVRGKIDPDADADFYRIEVTQVGALTVTTSLVDADLTLDIEDAGGTTIAKSDRGAARVREGVPNLGVQPGRYTVIVRKKPPPVKKQPRAKKGTPPPAPAPGPAVSYEVTASLAAPGANAEREPDDDRGTANDLIVGDTAQGFIGWSGDVDLWKLSVETLSSKNSIDIEVGGVEGVALIVELADGVGQPLLVRRVPKSSPVVIKHVMPVVPSGAPPFHYLTIKGDKSNPETHYTLRVKANPVEPDQEAEPNDTPEKAMAFPADRKGVQGNWTAGDTDCYAIAADVNPRTFEIELDPAEVDLALDLLVDGKVIAKSENKGKGTVEKLAGAVPPNAKAVIRIRAAADATGEGGYELTVREGPGAAGPP